MILILDQSIVRMVNISVKKFKVQIIPKVSSILLRHVVFFSKLGLALLQTGLAVTC